MISLYDELSGKLERESGAARRSGARADIGLLLFSNRNALRDLWLAAERQQKKRDAASWEGLGDAASWEELRDAVEKLRPLFGERPGL